MWWLYDSTARPTVIECPLPRVTEHAAYHSGIPDVEKDSTVQEAQGDQNIHYGFM